MKSLRLAVGVLPALACSSFVLGCLGTAGCSESSRKDPTPSEAARGPAGPVATPTSQRDQGATPKSESAGASKAGEPVTPTVKPDPARDVSLPTEFEHPPEDETKHRHAPRAVAGSLEGLDLQGNPRWTCREEGAYRAKAAAVFSDGAPSALTEALNEIAKKATPMSLVLQRKRGVLSAALSATQHDGANKEAFLPGKEAPFAPLVLAFGGDPTVTTDEPLARGYLQLFDKKGPVVLELRRLLWKATRGAGCEQVEVDVHATIPFTAYGQTLHLAKGDKTIAELASVAMPPEGADDAASVAGDGRGAATRLSIHFTFPATLTSFEGGAR